jgi:Fur family ferric uptake transcriptional regulator
MLVDAYNAEKIKAEVKDKFVEFLEKHQQRKTPERFAILDEIYSNKEHFDVETLFEHMMDRNYRVSRATVYNTLDLLLDCGLVIKHQFGRNISRYERAYGFRQHDHLICNQCNEVLEFCDPRIQQIKTTMGELMQFNITNHSLYLFGEPMVDADSKCMSCKKIVKKEK